MKLYNDEGAQQEINEPQIIEKLNHSWDKGVITEEATCEKDGTKTFTCEICNETRIETIEKTGHNWGEYVEVKKATVDSEGLKIRTCKNNSQHTQSGVLEKLPLQIVYGEYTNYTSDSNEDITIKANGTFSKFVELRIDGVKVDSKNYTIKEGSTIVTLNQEYLNTLSSGKHTITFVYNDNRKIDAIINIAKREQQNEDIKENNKNENDKKEDNTVQENEDNNLKNENTSLSPQTGDNITNYIAWFLISALGILVSTRFLKKK